MKSAFTTVVLSMLMVIFFVTFFSRLVDVEMRKHYVIAGLISGAIVAGMLGYRAWRLHR